MRSKLLKFFQTILILSFIISALSFIKKEDLSASSNIKLNIEEPVQLKTNEKPFEIKKRGIDYKIFPRYEYKLEGLVVSTHSISNWWDIKSNNKWGDYLNVKDICVIWGDNLNTDIYQNMTFSSSTWACYASGYDKKVTSKFNPNEMSNNHLLTDNPEIMKKIFYTKIGDIIHIEGLLVDYCYNDCKFSRETSVVRTDKGDGSCETVFVKDYEIINSNRFWQILFALSKIGMIISIAGIVIVLTVKKR